MTSREHAAGAGPGPVEFVILMALMTSMVALSIDAMLPALPEIAADLGVERVNDSQYVILVFFAGMALGQLFFGPLSDSIGRRPAIIAGVILYTGASLLSLLAGDFSQMLGGRFLQGIGAAGPRIVSVALVRDRFKGREMARVMSFIMMIFILVPIFAPALGQGILLFADWRAIFALFVLLAIVGGTWFRLRQPETLAPDLRLRLSLARLMLDTLGVLRHRVAMGYTLTMGFVFGAFVAYLSGSQQIFQVQYGLGNLFPLYFGILAAVIGFAALINARLVLRLGMRRLTRIALRLSILLSLVFLILLWSIDGQPALYLLMIYLVLLFFCYGILFGNLNAMAMEPLGHIAGLGSAVVGSLSTLISVFFGIAIADAYDGTVVPMVLGFTLLGFTALLVVGWTERGLTAEG